MDKKYLQGYSDLTQYSICESLKGGNDLTNKAVKLLVYDIDYDITDEDCEDNNCTKEQLLTKLPKDLLIDVDYIDESNHLHSKYVKFLFDLSDAAILSYDDCKELMSKLEETLRKVNRAKSFPVEEVPLHSSERDQEICVVCMEECGSGRDGRKMCKLNPCGHSILCSDCIKTIREMSLLCPCCRMPCYSYNLVQ